MKNMKSLFSICLLLVSVTLTSCFEQNDNFYRGPNLVEFSPASANVTVANNPVTYDVKIQLVSGQSATPLNITYRVTDASTAVEGVDYSFVETKGTLTIPPNSSFGYIKLTLNRPTANRNLVLELTGGDLDPNVNYRLFTLGIRR